MSLTQDQESWKHHPETGTQQENGVTEVKDAEHREGWGEEQISSPEEERPPLTLEGPVFCNQPEPLSS